MNVNDLLVELDKRDTLLANDAASTIRELLREVEKHTTPGGAHTVGEVMALCERWRVAGGREEHHAYKEEIERVVEKLVSDRDVLLSALNSIEHKLSKGRIWGGMDWNYNPLHPIHYKPAMEEARAAIQKVTNHD